MKKRIVNPGWKSYENLTFSPAVEKNGFLFISGLGANDGRVDISSLDIVAQCEVIYRKMKIILDEAGGTFADVVKTVDYILDAKDYRETAKVREKYLGPDFPAATGVVVVGLLGKGMLIEIDAIAIIDRPKAATREL